MFSTLYPVSQNEGLLCDAADPVVLQLTCVLALQRIITSLSSVVAGIIVAVIMIPLAQIQNIHDAGSLSVVATVAMITAAGIALIKLLAMPGSKLSETTLLLPPGTGHVTVLTAIMNLVFAFGGQVGGRTSAVQQMQWHVRV